MMIGVIVRYGSILFLYYIDGAMFYFHLLSNQYYQTITTYYSLLRERKILTNHWKLLEKI